MSPGAGPIFLFNAPFADEIFRAPTSGGEITPRLGLAGAWLVGRSVVRQNERMLCGVLFMLEEIIDSFFLHQPGNEVEVGLAVLDTVVPRMIGAVEPQFEVRESELAENFLEDVRRREMLE